jgi:hypothetical protein
MTISIEYSAVQEVLSLEHNMKDPHSSPNPAIIFCNKSINIKLILA